jgi:hypothetical protein
MKVFNTLLSVTLLMLAASAPAQTWKLATNLTISTSSSLTSVAGSADGKQVFTTTLGPIDPMGSPITYPFFTSSDSGSTWGSRFTSDDAFGSFGFYYWIGWVSIASSANGNKLIVSHPQQSFGSEIFVSTNAGIDWNVIDTSAYGDFGQIVSSADGSILAAVGSSIYVSTNSGATWTANTDSWDWTSVAMSADGSKMVATSIARNNPIYVSTNYGATWAATAAPNEYWCSVASSADGNKIVAVSVIPYGHIITSTNSGTTWTVTSAPDTNWISVASSADGNRLLGAVSGGQLFVSSNAGNTWTESSLPSCTNWNQVVCSADGGNLVAISTDGKIYTARSIRQPALSLQADWPALTISWTIPSTNFVLQQSADLHSWADVTNPPVLNLTNLQNQVTLPPSGSSAFYRLKTP